MTTHSETVKRPLAILYSVTESNNKTPKKETLLWMGHDTEEWNSDFCDLSMSHGLKTGV